MHFLFFLKSIIHYLFLIVKKKFNLAPSCLFVLLLLCIIVDCWRTTQSST